MRIFRAGYWTFRTYLHILSILLRCRIVEEVSIARLPVRQLHQATASMLILPILGAVAKIFTAPSVYQKHVV